MKKTILFSIFITLLILSNNTYAITEKYCVDNQTLRTVVIREICDKKGCENISISEDIECEYGCNQISNECYQSPLFRWGLVGILIALVLLIIYFLVVVRR